MYAPRRKPEDTSDNFWKGERNPLPAKTKIWDFFDNPDGWQRRLVIEVDKEYKQLVYETYYRDMENGIWGNWYHWGYAPSPWTSIAHVRRWSKDWTR